MVHFFLNIQCGSSYYIILIKIYLCQWSAMKLYIKNYVFLPLELL